jgi:hypothetical protein
MSTIPVQNHVRQIVRIPHPSFSSAYWTIALWWIGQGKVSQAIFDAGVAFALATGVSPQFALIRNIPSQAQEFVEVKGICLVQDDWVPDGFLVVTAGGMRIGLPKFEMKGASK